MLGRRELQAPVARVAGSADALAASRASEARWMKGAPIGLVDGIPTTIKDQWLVKGWPNRKGSRTTPADPVTEDSPAVARAAPGAPPAFGAARHQRRQHHDR